MIPGRLAKVLIGLVVISMALTPWLSNVGDKLASFLEDQDKTSILKSANMNSGRWLSNNVMTAITTFTIVKCRKR